MKPGWPLRMALLVLGVLASSSTFGSSVSAADPVSAASKAALGDPDEPARAYLGQSLAALAWARRYAEFAARSGALEGFDLARYRAELDTIIDGVERYLRPVGPPRGPLTQVEITGQFLLEGLRRRTPDGNGEVKP